MSRGETSPKETDWKAIRERIERLGALIRDEEREGTRSDLLRRRARALARPREKVDLRESLELVVVEVAGERFGLESQWVTEVFRCSEMALLPGAVPPLIGLVPWRGEILRVLDLQQLVGRRSSHSVPAEHFIVVGSDAPAFALPVERVRGLQRLALDEVQAVEEWESSRIVLGISSDAVLVLAMRALIHPLSEETK